MSRILNKLRTPFLAVGAALSLSACGYYGTGVSVGYNAGYGYDDGYYDDGYGYYDDGYGYGYGSSHYDVFGDPFFSGRYGYTPSYGWYNNYFYPGTGYYIYDRRGGRHAYGGDQRRFWDRNRGSIRDRRALRDYRDYDRGTAQGRAFQDGRTRDREALQRGDLTREQFRANRQQARRQYNQGLRQDFQNGNSLRGGNGVGMRGEAARARHREIRQEVRRNRAERRQRGD